MLFGRSATKKRSLPFVHLEAQDAVERLSEFTVVDVREPDELTMDVVGNISNQHVGHACSMQAHWWPIKSAPTHHASG